MARTGHARLVQRESPVVLALFEPLFDHQSFTGRSGTFFSVREGRRAFRPRLLRRTEFLAKASSFAYYDVAGQPRRLRLPPGSLAFTYCQVPVVYRLARKARLVVTRASGLEEPGEEMCLDVLTSRSIFARDGPASP